MKIYGISGLGADERVFEHLKLEFPFEPIAWLQPESNESISHYAVRLSQIIDTSQPFVLMGVSFGGLIAIEISKIIQPVYTILISSVAIRSDLPVLFRVVGKTGLLKLVPKSWLKPPTSLVCYLFGTNRKQLLEAILDDTDLCFAKWATQALLTWDNKQLMDNVLVISGKKDKFLKPNGRENEVVITDGQHLMIVDKADEVSAIINQRLREMIS